MDSIKITYKIKLSEKVTEVFDFTMDGKTFDLVNEKVDENPPSWTELGYKQCSNCPLNKEEHTHCPMALQLNKVVKRFNDTRSIDMVELEVITENRTVSKKTALQNAISSLLGLVFPISGCPKEASMKPLARFHVPLASEEETVFHVSGMYLLAQYFINNQSKQGHFTYDGLIAIYDDLHIVNKTIASRLQGVTSSDSVKNAITLLDMYSTLVPILLQDQLAELRVFFGAFLPEGMAEIESTNNYLEQAKAFKLELIPMDGEEAISDKNKKPEWLREVRDTVEEEEIEVPVEPISVKKVEPVVVIESPPLSSFSLSDLSLELTEEEKAKQAAAALLVAKPVGERVKAVFILPDDMPDNNANTGRFTRVIEKKPEAIVDPQAVKTLVTESTANKNDVLGAANTTDQKEVIADKLVNKFKSFLTTKKD